MSQEEKIAPDSSRDREPMTTPLEGQPYLKLKKMGKYLVECEVGRGGMGTVFKAHRVDNPNAKVALKLSSEPQDESAQQRFDREIEALSTLNHPNIACFIDAGHTENGHPWLAMEWIEGWTIDQWCDKKKLNVDQRIRLFLKVCEAVAYAHRSMIIHRDLKPANIMVNERGEPKLLDFGLAKYLEGSHAAKSTLTRVGGALMTPEYASPEQVAGEPLNIGTDVYSLGIVLYELVTGARPYSFETGSPAEIYRAVCEKLKPLASEKVKKFDNPITNIAGMSRERLAKELRGDLDRILEKALQRCVEERYERVEDFANDLRLYIHNFPIRIGKSSRFYRLKKAIKRHPFNTAIAILFTIFIAAFLAQRKIYLDKVIEDKKAIQQEQQIALEVTDFMVALFKKASPSYNNGEQYTAIELLDRGLTEVDQRLDKGSPVKVRIKTAMAEAYIGLENNRRAFEIANSLLETEAELDVRTQGRLHIILSREARNRGLMDQSEELVRKALVLLEDVNETHWPEYFEAQAELARMYFDRAQPEEAVRIGEALLAQQKSLMTKQTNEREKRAIAKSRIEYNVNLMMAYSRIQRHEEAQALKDELGQMIETYRVREKDLLDRYYYCSSAVLLRISKYQEAYELLKRGIVIGQELYHPHSQFVVDWLNLKFVLEMVSEKTDTPKGGLGNPMRTAEAVYGICSQKEPSFTRCFSVMNNIGEFHLQKNDYELAKKFYRKALSFRVGNNTYEAHSLVGYGLCMALTGDWEGVPRTIHRIQALLAAESSAVAEEATHRLMVLESLQLAHQDQYKEAVELMSKAHGYFSDFQYGSDNFYSRLSAAELERLEAEGLSKGFL